ncbi:MAG: 50S ribosomal protein L9 [Proteobacteria bacterium]|nr:50S ribosomal protein L9 [Pseudomonadota bacterium]
MNVILLEPLTNLGELGDEVTVKPGFARNYLIPKGKAVRATDDNRAVFEARRAELEAAASDRLTSARGRAALLAEVALTLVVRAGEEGKLYGSVGTQDIANELVARGFDVERSEVRMPDGPIRSTGEFLVSLQFHSDVVCEIPVTVEPE